MQSIKYRATAIAAALFTALMLPAQTLTIEECRQMAVESSSRTKNAELDKKSALEQKKEALWAYFPSASINGGTFYALNPMLEITLKDVLGSSDMAQSLISEIESYAHSYGINPVYTALSKGQVATLSVSQPVFVGGRIVNSNRLAKLGYEAASLKQTLTEREILDEVESAYWQTVSLEEKNKTLNQAIALVENICGTVSAAVGAGLATRTDLLQAEQKLSSLKSDATKLSNGIILSKMNLCNLIGQDFAVLKAASSVEKPYIGDISFGSLPVLESPEKFYRDEEEICRSMEEVKLLSLSEEASRLQKKITVGESLPQLSIGASYGYNNILNHQSVNGMVYAMVKIPLTDWGGGSHKIRNKEYQAQKAANDREYLSEQVLLGVRKLWMDAVAAWQQIDAEQQATAVAEARLKSVEADYKAGLATSSDLLQAQTSLLESRQNLTDSQTAYQIAIRKYLNVGR
ncbi:MAG: TolC family protein [Bacteroidales bacterium]|nr:TolC family protein [Bacteroidales bacterium]